MTRYVAIVGPTAVGKSALGLAIARRRGGEIVNADALQAYRGLDVGTAKPTAEERAEIPHHLVDFLDPRERWSAGEFARQATAAIAEISARGRLPIVVGGSGFYLRALAGGLPAMPPVPEAVRTEVAADFAAKGLAALRRELQSCDPATAARLAPGDTQRTLRALEVARSTGVPLSAWQQLPASGAAPAVAIALTLPRAVLYDRIALRVGRMAQRGWVEEVERLLELGLDPACPAFQAIGYREMVRHVRGEMPLDATLREIATATRHLAKRQLTWFRRDPALFWHEAEPEEAALDAALREVDAALG